VSNCIVEFKTPIVAALGAGVEERTAWP